MRNAFNIEVSFASSPLMPYEWERVSFITGIKVVRVSTKCLIDLMTREAVVKSNNKILLLSDTKSAVVLRLNDKCEVVKRSFLNFSSDENICEAACNMKETTLEYSLKSKKVKYSCVLREDIKMRQYLVKSISEIDDENKSKYLYYLYFDKINDYSKEKLIKSIQDDDRNRCQELYNFLTKN